MIKGKNGYKYGVLLHKALFLFNSLHTLLILLVSKMNTKTFLTLLAVVCIIAVVQAQSSGKWHVHQDAVVVLLTGWFSYE